jgi:hypothetical protein
MILVFLLFCSIATAQSAYLPLEEGNHWELRSGRQSMTLEVTGRSGEQYRVRWTNPWVRTEFLFVPNGNQVLLTGLDMGNGVAQIPPGTVYFDFDMRQGGSWSNALGRIAVTARDKRVDTRAGRFEHCIEIRATDKKNFDTYWTFAPGVGFVQFGQGGGAFLLESYSTGGGAPRSPEPPREAPSARRAPREVNRAGAQVLLGLDANPAPNEGYGSESMRKRFLMAVETGTTYTSFLPKWDELEPSAGRYRFDDLDQRVRFADENHLPISLNIRVVDGDHRAMPSRYQGWKFDDPKLTRALTDLLKAVGPRVHGRVKWIALGNEVDHYFEGHRNEIGPYAKLLDNVIGAVRDQFPGAQFTINFSDQHVADLNGRYAPITSKVEFFSFNYYPVNSDFTMRPPDVAGPEMLRMIQSAGNKQVMFQELGYASSPLLNSSEEKQAQFVANAFEVLRQNRGRVIAATFNWMSDLPQSVVDSLGQYYKLANSDRFKAFLGTLGLFDRNGRPKPAWQEFQRQARTL